VTCIYKTNILYLHFLCFCLTFQIDYTGGAMIHLQNLKKLQKLKMQMPLPCEELWHICKYCEQLEELHVNCTMYLFTFYFSPSNYNFSNKTANILPPQSVPTQYVKSLLYFSHIAKVLIFALGLRVQ
jgi:hypothetical protein